MAKTMIRKTVLYGIARPVLADYTASVFWMLSASLKPETAVFQFPIQWIRKPALV